MANVFGYSVTVRFECPFCQRNTEKSGAFTLDTNDEKLVQQQIDAIPLKCQHCHAEVPRGTQLTVVRLDRTADQL